MTRLDNSRVIRPATGSTRTAQSWLTEAPLRMLMNNLHPDVAENPHELVVYGGIGRAARSWAVRPALSNTTRSGRSARIMQSTTTRPISSKRSRRSQAGRAFS